MNSSNRIANWTIIIIVLILAAKPFLGDTYLHLMTWDTFGYYLYLPEAFIQGDLTLSDSLHVAELYNTHQPSSYVYQIHLLENGNNVMQYSSGVAVLSIPFFWIGHFFAWLFNYPLDGFSAPYLWAFLAGSYAYMIIGIVFFRKVLRTFFSDKLTAFLLILIYLGTNYFNIQLASPCMSHVYLFALYVLVLWGTIKWYSGGQLKHMILIAISTGLIIITRPLDGLIVLIPFLWNVNSIPSFKERLSVLWAYKKQLILSIFVCFLVICIQLVYWKYVTGSFVFNSYVNPEEGLYLEDPHLIDFLFSYRKGWFIYTPIMLIMIGGFFVKSVNKEKWILSISLFLLLYVYASASWSTWWYGYSFSQRTMMQTYPLLALPLGALIESSLRIKWWKYSLGVLLLFFTSLNLFQTYQFQNNILHGSLMTSEEYWSIFGEVHAENVDKSLLMIDRDNLEFIPEEYADYEIFELDPSGTEIEKINESNPYSKVLNYTYNQSSNQDYAWYLIECDVKIPVTIEEGDFFMTGRFKRNDRYYGARYFHPLNSPNYKANEWFHAEFLYLTPTLRGVSDQFECFSFCGGDDSVLIKNLKSTSYVKK